MRKQKIQVDPGDYPAELHRFLNAGTVYDSSSGTDAKTLYCDSGYYIKIAKAGALKTEAELGSLFHRMGLGVAVVRYLSTDRDYLVTESAQGEDLTHYLEDPVALCGMLADALRRLHSQPVRDVPMSAKLRLYRANVNAEPAGGEYDPWVLMDRFPVASRQEAWDLMQKYADRLQADTLIHGDACLPNIIFRDGVFSAFIDFDCAGAGDKHIDLYWALWSLRYNLKTEAYADLFLDLYGRENFDADLLKAVAAFEFYG